MKKLKVILFAAILVCILGTAVFLILAPDRIPVHYNFAGEVDRIGSKYENLVFPLFSVGFGVFFLLFARNYEKKNDASSAKALLLTGVCTLLFFTLLSFYFMWKDLTYDPQTAPHVSPGDVNRFVSIGVGAMLILIGNFLPKVRRNSLIGLRTRWSMENDAVWQKSQRFGGFASVAAGLCMIVLSVFIPGLWNLLMMVVVIVIWTIVCSAASRRYYLADKQEREQTK